MTLDLMLLGAVLLFALLGALQGASRQVAQWGGVLAALLAARPAGRLLGPVVAERLQLHPLLANLAVTAFAFFVVHATVRWVLARMLQHALQGGQELESRKVDRSLGFALGGLKVAFVAYIAVCLVSFVEENLVLAGRRLHLSPKDSVAFALARRFNLVERMQFGPLRDLVQVAQGLSSPKLRDSDAFRELNENRRFQAALASDDVRRALEAGDTRTLLQNPAVLQLIQDPTVAAQLAKAAEISER